MQLRIMSGLDIAAGMRLKEIAGWNQTAEDWKRFLEASSAGCFVAEVDGAVRGTATTISYDDKFAWVGMVLVDPEYRGQGIGTQLLRKTIEYLDDAKIGAIKLDATPQGKPIYEKLGFVPEYEIERMILKRTPPKSAQLSQPGEREPLDEAMVKAIIAKDRKVFGADRSGLLASLHDHAPELSVASWQDRNLRGYAFGRHGSFADHLGPWVATDAQDGQCLLQTFLQRSTRETVLADCLKSNHFAGDLLRAHGFSYSRPLTRMYRGTNQFPGRSDLLCAILGPEFG
jgi:GNAT superfamily N-acetyltransferase